MKPINSVPEKEEKMWSTEFPQVEDGVYWIRYHEGGDADIGRLSCGLVQVAGGAFISDSRHRIEYLGPISPSDTEELLALRGQLNNAADLEMLARDEINALREAANDALTALQSAYDYYMGRSACGDFTCSCNNPELCGMCEMRQSTETSLAELRKALGKE